MNNTNVICPKCLGTAEVMHSNVIARERICSLCQGEGEVNSILEEDYISSIQVIYDEELPIY